jgi:ATP-dependent Clp protease adaptor protein ClpS
MGIKSKPAENEQNNSGFSGENKSLILYNDNIHTFEYVIEALIKVCGHNTEQAEQCTLIAHYKGKCPIKNGTEEELLRYYKELTTYGLITKIE